jgi:hypothetical protein
MRRWQLNFCAWFLPLLFDAGADVHGADDVALRIEGVWSRGGVPRTDTEKLNFARECGNLSRVGPAVAGEDS